MNEIMQITQKLDNKKEVDLPSLTSVYLSDLDVSQASKETYQTALTNFFHFLNELNISYPTRADLLLYKEKLSSSHTAKTVNLQFSVIRSFFTWTNYYGIYPNVAFGIKGVRVDKNPKRQALSSEQIKSILESIDQSNLCGRQKYAMVLLAATTGLRASEIANLDIADLQVVQNVSTLRVKGKGYSDKGQLVQIGKHTDEAIRAALALRSSFNPDDPLFVSTSNFSSGSRITPKGVGKILKKVLNDNNFTGSFYTGHSLRHSACCLGLEVTDRDLIGVRNFMRHQNLETTLIYADHEEFLSRNIAQEIEKKLL